MDDCKCLPEHRIQLEDHVEEVYLERQHVLRTTRIRQSKCKLCGQIWNNGVDLDAARHNTDVDGHYGVTYAE